MVTCSSLGFPPFPPPAAAAGWQEEEEEELEEEDQGRELLVELEEEREIHIEEGSYEIFKLMLEYIYTGEPPYVLQVGSQTDPMMAAELLALADQYMLDHFKQLCEARLTEEVREDTVESILELAERSNSWQLRAVCRHYTRNREMDFSS